MVDPFTAELWARRLLLLSVVFVAIFFKLLPLQSDGSTLPSPDVIFCLMAAWAIRRPALVPLGMVVGIGLLSDFLFLRPPGIWTMMLILSFEVLRIQGRREGMMSAANEAGSIAVVFVLAFLGNRLILAVFAVPQAPLGATLLELLLTLMAYPLVAFVTVFIFRVRHPDPTDIQGLRGRG